MDKCSAPSSVHNLNKQVEGPWKRDFKIIFTPRSQLNLLASSMYRWLTFIVRWSVWCLTYKFVNRAPWIPTNLLWKKGGDLYFLYIEINESQPKPQSLPVEELNSTKFLDVFFYTKKKNRCVAQIETRTRKEKKEEKFHAPNDLPASRNSVST